MNLHIQKNGGKKSSSKGFYIALGVCLIAVGVAAWTTYDSVVNYATPEDEPQSEALQSTAPTNNTVSGVYGEPEASQPASSSQPESSQPAVSSVAPSNSEAVSSQLESKPTPESKNETPTANQPTSAKVTTYSYPVGKTVIRKFSTDPIYCKTTLDWRAHTGVDFSAKQGDPVKAIADGKVTKAYKDDKLGNTVIISHGDVEAWYCGLEEMKVKAGDTVKSGQELGTIGTVPNEQEEESHLHFVTKINGEYTDPLTLLK